MESALAWIGKLAEWFGQFFPRWEIIPPTYGGVKFVRGKKIVPMHPGINWWWPATTKTDGYPIVRQTDNLPSQTFLLADNKTITVSGMVIYEVEDVVKLLTQSHSAVHTIRDISLAAIHDVCAKMDLAQLHGEQRRGTLNTKLKNETKKQLEEYGVKVLKVQLTDLAPARVLRVVQSLTKDED